MEAVHEAARRFRDYERQRQQSQEARLEHQIALLSDALAGISVPPPTTVESMCPGYYPAQTVAVLSWKTLTDHVQLAVADTHITVSVYVYGSRIRRCKIERFEPDQRPQAMALLQSALLPFQSGTN